jgi:hypothetical protein
MVEAFAPFGVTKDHIETLIQRRLDAITAAQVVRLKRIYASLRDEMSVPAEWFEMAPAGEADDDGVIKPASKPASAAEAVAARRAARQKTAQAAADKAATKGAGTEGGGPGKRTLQQYLDAVYDAPDSDAAAMVVDEARGLLSDDEHRQLGEAYSTKWQAPE